MALNPSATATIPKQVFEEFLTQLESSGAPKHVIVELRAAILEKGDLSETAIQAALFAEAPEP